MQSNYLFNPSISLIFSQSHSNLTHFQQQSTSVEYHTIHEAKYFFLVPICVLIVPQGLV